MDIDNRHRHLCVTGVTFMSSNTFLSLVPSWERFFYKSMKIPSFHIWQNHTEIPCTPISLLLITRGKINMTNFCNNFHSGILLGWQNDIAVLPIFSLNNSPWPLQTTPVKLLPQRLPFWPFVLFLLPLHSASSLTRHKLAIVWIAAMHWVPLRAQHCDGHITSTVSFKFLNSIARHTLLSPLYRRDCGSR